MLAAHARPTSRSTAVVQHRPQDIGALEAGREKLTLLGRHLAALPLPPRVGKLLLYGVLFRCLDPVLTIACAMAFRRVTALCLGLLRQAAGPVYVQQVVGCSPDDMTTWSHLVFDISLRTSAHAYVI